MPLCDTYDFIPLSMRILKVAADLYPNDFELVKAADGQIHISRVTGSHEMGTRLGGQKGSRQPSDGMGTLRARYLRKRQSSIESIVKLLELAEVSMDDVK